MNEYNTAIKMINNRITELGVTHKITVATIDYWSKILNISDTELLIKAMSFGDVCLQK